jgi:hypothetical protein
MKSARTTPLGLRLAVLFATVAAFLLAGAPARAEGGDDGGMQIQVVVSGNPEATPTPTPTQGGGGGGLAVTGLNIVLIAGVGVGLVALGTAAVLAARRRSARTGTHG